MIPVLRAAALLLALAAPAAAGEPPPAGATPVTVTGEGVTARLAVPDAGQNRAVFGVDPLAEGIQPVWLEIANTGESPLAYLPATTDSDYFAPLEVAWRFHQRLRHTENAARDARFRAAAMPTRIAPGATESGYVVTHRETGLKFLNLGLVRDGTRLTLRAVVPVAGPELAVERVDLAKLYPPGEIRDVDEAGLRAALAALPCCGTDARGAGEGDPLNIVLVGDGLSIGFPLVARGWRFTEPLDLRTAADAAEAFVLDRGDPELPVSPMVVFGRREDMALQKPRATLDQRNHLRLWLTPLRFEGRSVFVGQISRDIGVEFTTRSWYLTTHRIDPFVDDDRDALLEDLLLSGALAHFGYVGGVGASPEASPRLNLEGDPYVTDGLRLVAILDPPAEQPVGAAPLGWEEPPARP
jgi:hypothetical protein